MTHGETVMKVGVKTPHGTIIRFKDPREAGYKLGEEVFKACKTEQPKAVSDILSLSETNFQSQHDSMFLLDATPGARAKEINKLIALEDIDLATSWLKSKSAKLATLIQAADDKIAALDYELEGYAGLTALSAKYIELLDAHERIEETYVAKAELEDLIKADSQIETELGLIWFKQLKLSVLINAMSDLEATKASKSALESLCSDQRAVESLPRLDAAIEALHALIETKNRLDSLRLLIAEQNLNETSIQAKIEKIRHVVAEGSTIVEMTKKKRETLSNILVSLKAIKGEYLEAASASETVSARLAELEKPSRCQACGKCVLVCETC